MKIRLLIGTPMSDQSDAPSSTSRELIRPPGRARSRWIDQTWKLADLWMNTISGGYGGASLYGRLWLEMRVDDDDGN